METSLRFDSGKKHLKLFAKEKFSNDDNYVLTVRRRDRPQLATAPIPPRGHFTLDPLHGVPMRPVSRCVRPEPGAAKTILTLTSPLTRLSRRRSPGRSTRATVAWSRART